MLDAFDPRSKLIMVLAVSSLAVAFDEPLVLLTLAAITLATAALFGAGVIGALTRMRRLLGVFAAMGVIQSVFTRGGQALVEIGGITLLSTTGLERGASIILRILIIVVSASIMSTSNPRDIVQGLSQWKIPYELSFMVAVAIRFLPLLREEAEDTLVALQLRGVRLEQMRLGRKLSMYRRLLTPLIAGVLSRAENMSISVEMRGFRAFRCRTSHRHLKFGARDYTLVFATALSVVAVLFWRL